MKTQRQYIKSVSSLLIASTFLGLTSCRSTDTESNLINGGVALVKVNLTGTDFSSASGNNLAQASLKSTPATSDVQRHGAMLTPGMLIEAELKPSAVSTSAQASTKLNTLAVAPGNTLGNGMMFRVIAYRQSDGSYQDHKDYTIGQPVEGLTLDLGATYYLVVYSYGTSTLPTISAGELDKIGNAQVAYDNSKPDFMYQNINYTPNNPTNTVNFTLRHKVSLITATVNSLIGNIESISNAYLSPHNTVGTFALSNGVMANRSGAINESLNFGGSFPALTKTSDPLFVNADTGGTLGGTFGANITIDGVLKTVTLPNTFKITPEYKNDLTINLKTCGAYTAPGVFTEFMCQNLGATPGTDPFSTVADNHGAKYQWGTTTGEANRYYTQAQDQANSGIISGWATTSTKTSTAWNSGTIASPVKTANDPCPSGYRVPTQAEWTNVTTYNNATFEAVGSWASDAQNYGSAIYYRNASNVRTMMLPAAGTRINNTSPNIGVLKDRGAYGYYWTSTQNTTVNAYNLSASPLGAGYPTVYNNAALTDGMSVRCIRDNKAINSSVNGGNTSWSSSGNINVTTTF